jgi:hypothetical protein
VDSGGRTTGNRVAFELENDAGGLRWTLYPRHGIQKVRGSNPLGSTKFLNTKSRPLVAILAARCPPDMKLDTFLGGRRDLEQDL